jgi:hypothetical protein
MSIGFFYLSTFDGIFDLCDYAECESYFLSNRAIFAALQSSAQIIVLYYALSVVRAGTERVAAPFYRLCGVMFPCLAVMD